MCKTLNCPNTDGTAAITVLKCSCGGKRQCGKGQSCKVTGKKAECVMSNCSNTDGTAVNTAPCKCGMMYCGPGQSCTAAVTGTFTKMAALDRCGFAPCASLDGKKPSELMECQCGHAICIKGMTCMANTNLCITDLPPCLAGSNAQTYKCKCKKTKLF
jgi:hypothetical protein